MFNSKKKRAAKLEAEKEAARKIMEEAGLDLGHEAAKIATTKSTKGALLPISP
jgi:phosphoribosylamine-glycine ligase